jgi:hypothetical protein
MFPEIVGSNLENKEYLIPQDLAKEINLVIIAFKRFQQLSINQWVLHLEKLQKKYPNFEFYELPVLAQRNRPIQFWIDGGMRAGIADRRTRERTITIYINKQKLKEPLKIKSEDLIHLFLITRKGDIIWQEKGDISIEKLQNLENVLKNR